LRRRRLDNDVRGDSDRRRPPTSPHASSPQRRAPCRAPHQPVGGAPERLPRSAVQEEVCGKVDVEQLLDDFLNEDEKTIGHVRWVDGRLEEDVDTNGVAGNVEQQEYRRYQQQHLRHLKQRHTSRIRHSVLYIR